MNDTEKTQLINEAFGGTETAMTTPIRETINYLDGRGMLNQSATKVEADEIKAGDWIAYFFESGTPGEFYQARSDGDTNYNGNYGEFFRVERELFGKSKPDIKVEDLEPGARFKASLLGRPVVEFVRGKGRNVFKLGAVGIDAQWVAINGDFSDIEIID